MSPPPPPNEDPTICFTTVENLFDAIRTLDGNFLVVSDVSLAAYKKIKIERKAHGHHIRFFYDQKELRITMPTGPYERAYGGLYTDHVVAQMTLMKAAGSPRRWMTMAVTAFPSEDGTHEGEGDSTGGPIIPERLGPHHWPTLAIEAGYTQSHRSLMTKMRWWFNESNHQVIMVIIAKLHPSLQTIVLEKYTEDRSAPRSVAIHTRAYSAAILEPTPRQQIWIRKNPNGQSV